MIIPTSSDSAEPPAETVRTKLSPTVRALGIVSLCTDMSSEMVYPINPIFVTRVLGAPAWTVGLIEGIAESTASILKLYSGYLSDRAGVRKPFALAGYGLAAISKPLLGASGTWVQVLFARFLDRTGKGLRGTPRDALIADTTDPSQRGRAFGLHRTMDTTGAVLGPLIGYFFLRAFPNGFRALYWLAFAPALVGIVILALFVRESRKVSDKPIAPLRFTLSGLSREYRQYLVVVLLFGLGNSSDAFLLLRAQDLGIGSGSVLLLYTLFNIVEAALGYTAGRFSDRVGRRPLIIAGYLIFALVYGGFAIVRTPLAVWFLFPIYGFYYTLTQGAQKALAADLSHPQRRGTEMGAFHLLVGAAALPSSLIAGWLYGHISPAAPFVVGAITAVCAALLLATNIRRSKDA